MTLSLTMSEKIIQYPSYFAYHFTIIPDFGNRKNKNHEKSLQFTIQYKKIKNELNKKPKTTWYSHVLQKKTYILCH